MLRRIGIGLLSAIVAYVIGAFGGGSIVSVFSTNQHDKGMEAAMTSAFVFGPLGAGVSFALGPRCAIAKRPHNLNKMTCQFP